MPVGLTKHGANRNNHKLLKDTLDSIPIERPEPTPWAPRGEEMKDTLSCPDGAPTGGW